MCDPESSGCINGCWNRAAWRRRNWWPQAEDSMRYSLINPPWRFDGSIYFGCREPHLPLEYGYSRALLEAAGHDVDVVDAQIDELSLDEGRRRIESLRPDFTGVTTAPSYLFLRWAPPELRVPLETVRAVREVAGTIVAVGPHASTTPEATRRKLGADVVIMGECEELLPRLAEGWRGGQTSPHAADMTKLPALHWSR